MYRLTLNTLILIGSLFYSFYAVSQPFTVVTKNIGIPPLSNTKMAAGDLDTDNDMDIVISGTNACGAAVSRVLKNNGDTTFTTLNFPLTQFR